MELSNFTYEQLERMVMQWGTNKGIIPANDPKPQLLKFFEEAGELASACAKGDSEAEKDALGDVLVTLILYSAIQDKSLTACLESAYKIIALRTGVMKNGVFIKDV